jgi:quercetin dioxygenase-like cupin family protein
MAILHLSDAQFTEILPNRYRYLAYTDRLMMVVIDFNDGPHQQPDPPHAHPHEQVTYVVEGEMDFFMDGVPTRVRAGDIITVPGNIPHCVQLVTPHVRAVDVFTPIREDFLPK